MNREENWHEKILSATSKRGNQLQKILSVPHSKKVRNLIRDYIRSRRIQGERVTVTQVRDFPVSSNILPNEESAS